MTDSRRERALTAARIRLRSPIPRPLLDETRIDEVCAELLDADAHRACSVCHEAPRDTDPGLSNGVCCFCGYWGVAPGLKREEWRAQRAAQNRNPESPPPSDSQR